MSYTALYRKFRPDTFADVKGQDHIVTTLKNQIMADRIGHAYLFCGTRGTGKTTIAKILAKAVNCEHPVDGNPCNECDTCKAISAGSSMNVIEIDAASNNGVDNIREIRDEVAYSPTEGRFKVYIIDEVHMLSIGAFNALLKTLEEPPSYVIFILATTEAHKIPITILSRCQRYDFKRIALTTISSHLNKLMEEEQVEVEAKAANYIAKKADGSMRDALSLLDQCIAFYLGQKLTYDNVLEVLGAVDTDVFSDILRMVLSHDVAGAMAKLEELVMQGRELTQFVVDFTWYMRNLLLLKTSDNMEDVLDVSTENMKKLQEEAGMIREDTLMRFIRIFSELSNQIKYASSKRILLEIALIKLCKPEMENDEISLVERIRLLEKKLESGIAIQQVQPAPGSNGAVGVPGGTYSSVNAEAPAAGPVNTGIAPDAGQNVNARMPAQGRKLEKAAPQDLQEVKKIWNSIVAETEGRFKIVLSMAEPKYNAQGEDDRLFVCFKDFQGERYVASEERKEELERIIAGKIGKKVEVKMMLEADSHLNKGNIVSISVDDAIKEFIHTDVVIED